MITTTITINYLASARVEGHHDIDYFKGFHILQAHNFYLVSSAPLLFVFRVSNFKISAPVQAFKVFSSKFLSSLFGDSFSVSVSKKVTPASRGVSRP